MNILIFYQYFGTPKGGWSTRMYEMPKRWIEAGNKVIIVTSPYDKSDIKATKFIDKQVIDQIEVIIININHSNKHSIIYRAFTFLLFSVISIYFALTLKFDVIICSSGPITIGLPGVIAKFFRRKKRFVFEVRDLWPDGAIQLGLIKNNAMKKLAYYFEKCCYQSAGLVVTCSPGMTEQIHNRFPQINLLTIPNASDKEFFNKKDSLFKLPDWALNKKIFIYTGSIGLMDDCMQIIKGIELYDGKNEIFVFIGEGKERVSLEKYVCEKQIPNIYFLGLIPKTTVKNWLQNSYVAFVCFKDMEVLQTSSPNKMFDAFAAGVPIIQTTKGWIKDLVTKENCGITVDPSSASAMVAAINTMASDVNKRNQMSITCCNLAATEFNRDILSQKYLSALK